jgi:hypothetical protein
MSAFVQQLVAGVFGLCTALLAAWAKPFFEQRLKRTRADTAHADGDGKPSDAVS